ncbi:MBL fold metallo-hydrolase [Nocardia terpenica]|uniref:MBL fold metallo-hydrolase n=1 Tax=Nocardia terpenica TaxID=455432 RepID=UPI0009EECD11|nr:MBL fold metallo-hydrolase [Nocardia terpenica]MBF6062174.1 MBL fold metallo-hydrolase [Nocardia terpenica]MBF6104262.1 MBL fold metallo-hydrolase [Nocardia terpenica]MBF6109882.1 MBL fold metallo-hydrolase [Nocardia terpenica]MBF6120188.1 MBL fold metallo-hydrolase [Nocardia terpenica]MBF6152599.1 MBL fold metallo-hydrolase [Nocardia terpenica]
MGGPIVTLARRVALGAAGAVGLTWIVRAAWGIPSALGASVSAIAPVATGSAGYRDRQFHNTEPSSQFVSGSGVSLLFSALTRRGAGHPVGRIPLAEPESPDEAGALAVTWYGHASALLEIDGYRILTDPVWSERVSPSSLVGPARLHPVPLPVDRLPRLDAVVISHDHYDHLDRETVRALMDSQDAPFIVPIGIGAHLRKWQVPDARIVELDWGTSVSLSELDRARDGDLTITCTEARHFSGRGLVRNTTLWASWAFAGPAHRAYFGGDTGYTKAFAEIGATLGPFDLTLLPIGAYDEHWPDVHMNPEEAVRAHADVCVGDAAHGLLVPIHWATFNLAFHGWSEPVRRLVTAARAAGTTVAVPLPGQRIDANALSPQVSWWEDVR